MKPRTLYFAVFPKPFPADWRAAYHWMPWLRCAPAEDELTTRMVLHRRLRDRGGIRPDEQLTLTVCSRPTMNTPCEVLTTTFVVTKP